MKKRNLFYLLFFLPLTVAFSQEKATFPISFTNVPASEALSEIESIFQVRFSYSNSLLDNKTISLDKKERNLDEVIEEVSQKLNIKFEIISDRYIVLTQQYASLGDIQVLQDVVVTGYLTKGITKNTDATFSINPKKLEILPGLIEADILESIQLLPGVISPNETATGFTVRGGALDQNRIIWDGINMYHKGHLFGMLSAFNPNSTSNVIVHNKGTHSRYGERVSSVIAINSTQEIADTFRAGIGINGINADIFLDVPIIKNRLSVQASLRRSYTEIITTPTFNEITDKVFQDTKITNLESTNNDFFFIDYNIKLNYKLNENNHFYASTLFIDNFLDYVIKDQDEDISYNDILDSKNDGYSLGWDKIWSPKLSQNTQVFLSRYSLAYNYIVSEEMEQVSDFEKRNEIYDSGISTELNYNLNTKNLFTFGYQYVLKDASYLFKETSDLSIELDSDKTVVRSHSGYLQYQYKNESLFDVNIGLRTNYYYELDAVRVEPRILLHKKLFQNFSLQISGEIKNQIISEIDETILSDLSLENKLWRLADGETFPIINSLQVSGGFIYSANGWSFDIDGYYKKIDGKTALSLGFLNPGDSEFHIGGQDIFGVDFYAKKDFRNFKTWVSYTYNDVTSHYDGINNNKDFTSNINIKHSITSSIAYKLNKLQIALAWNWRTGKPYTQANLEDDLVTYNFTGINTERLPNYHRLDFSATYDCNLSKNGPLKGKFGFSIRNLYNQNNQLSREYTGNNNINDPIVVVDKYSLGFTPNFLVRVYF